MYFYKTWEVGRPFFFILLFGDWREYIYYSSSMTKISRFVLFLSSFPCSTTSLLTPFFSTMKATNAVKRDAAAASSSSSSGLSASNKRSRTEDLHTEAATSSSKQYYLLKSEPDEFSIDDLAARPLQTNEWDGVRNHQAK